MLTKLRGLLKSETAADITAALASIDLDALRATFASAVESRTALLLSGNDGQLLKAEAAIEAARLAVDRAEAAKGALEAKLAHAQAAEAETAFRARYAEAVAQRDAVVAKVKRDYSAAAAKILEVLAADEAAAVAIRAVNKACADDVSYGLPAINSPSHVLWGSRIGAIKVGVAGISSFTAILPTPTTPAIDPNRVMDS